MFDIMDIILYVIIMLAVAFGVFITMRGFKKDFDKNHAHTVNAWSKKNRGILRTDNEELNRTYWKVKFWNTLLAAAVITPPGVLGLQAILGGWNLPFALVFLGICTPALVCAVLMRRKRRIEFNKLKDELGVELERDENEVKKVSGEFVKGISSIKILGIPFIFIFVFVMASLAVTSVTSFASGDFRGAIIYAVIIVINIPNLIFGVKFYIAKKRRGKSE